MGMSTHPSGGPDHPGIPDDTIRPFRLEIPGEALDDLRDRLARTRWATPLPGEPWARGVPVAYLRGLAAYWRDGYDWRTAEAAINAHPQFTTTIDGANVHFLHVRSTHDDALPLLLCHGWPGSFVEFQRMIGPLTQPEQYGGEATDAFHVVVPSIPGFTLSGPTPDEGWTEDRIASAFVTLMHRLGYERYGAQGGDFGAGICPAMGRLDPERIIGVHVNAASQGFIPWHTVEGEERESLSALDQERLDRLGAWMAAESGYFTIQGSKPETLAAGLNDSPAGQLAWIVEKFQGWTDPAKVLPEDAVDRDHLLTNVSLYWFTGTAGSSANLYYEGSHAGWGDVAEGGAGDGSAQAADGSSAWSAGDTGAAATGVPTGVAVFANDVAIRRYSEGTNHITHWSDFDTGGHFAAMETPDLLTSDVRAFFRTVR
ncbi:MAG: Epoxide hydrolase [uncultured Thermomicrobiales bacterium]|uniref:Epoxide hydrolase n=1 Tax=uncultured Thermomicrobiales bacterium TaxID=1645740 RepID=A0A6J4V7D4_9BACT|nr:MAG: Epoxide hydrolase [uncultured Thermomicrobiales bacterium]